MSDVDVRYITDGNTARWARPCGTGQLTCNSLNTILPSMLTSGEWCLLHSFPDQTLRSLYHFARPSNRYDRRWTLKSTGGIRDLLRHFSDAQTPPPKKKSVLCPRTEKPSSTTSIQHKHTSTIRTLRNPVYLVLPQRISQRHVKCSCHAAVCLTARCTGLAEWHFDNQCWANQKANKSHLFCSV